MGAYIARRLLLMIPTILGIMLISFVIVQFAPGGPVERIIAQLQGFDVGAAGRFSGGGGDVGQGAASQTGPMAAETSTKYRGAQGLDPKFIAELEKQFGFDKPAYERFLLMIKNYAMFDFGKSYFRDESVLSLIEQRLPVSMSLGLWMTLISYSISIPLGIAKAVRDGEKFDIWTSNLIIIGYAIPSFLFAMLLIVLFAGGSFWQIFPLRGLTSDNFDQLSLVGKILDYLWHIVLPVSALTLSAFATQTFLTKNSFLDEIRKQYVLIEQRLPVSMSLGLWMTLISYSISIPLGIAKAVRDGEKFDIWTSNLIIIGYAIPSFLFAMLLIVLFAGGSFWQIFPLRGLTSDNFDQLSLVGKILDYLWHIVLPVSALTLGAFATQTFLTKNSFLDEIRKQYVQTARMKGLTERRVLYGHVFRNAMLIVIAGFPGAFVHAFFTGSVLIETIFSLDGLGYLSFESIVNRDYPVVFASLYIFALLGLVVNLISDLTYTWIDPRIDFETREV